MKKSESSFREKALPVEGVGRATDQSSYVGMRIHLLWPSPPAWWVKSSVYLAFAVRFMQQWSGIGVWKHLKSLSMTLGSEELPRSFLCLPRHGCPPVVKMSL